MHHFWTRVAGLSLVLMVLIPNFSVSAEGNQYRRWVADKTYSCTTGAGVVYANLNNQNVEFNNLPANAQFTINYIRNGVLTVDGPYTVEQISGTKAYSAFAQSFPAYPFTFEFRLDTLIEGVVVYTSSVTINCAGDTASTPITPVNVDTGYAYRRWVNNKTFTCGPLGGGVGVFLNNQDVVLNNLPVGAEFTLNYIDNGVISTDGPYPVEASNGTFNYGSFVESFPAYPLTFEFRIDTLISGVVVYQSSLIINCTGDASGVVVPVNVVPGSGSVPSSGGCVAAIPGGSVQGRLIATTPALSSASASATTTIRLPAGSAWWVIGAQNGFYRLWIACQSNPVWFPAAALTPNYETGGAPLPAAS